jgi:hypothetical protein
MIPIQPVQEGTTGPKVTALHVGLLFLIGHQGNPPSVQQTLLAQLAPDVAQNIYGEATRSIVAIYQGQLKNWPNYWPKLPKNISRVSELDGRNIPPYRIPAAPSRQPAARRDIAKKGAAQLAAPHGSQLSAPQP